MNKPFLRIELELPDEVETVPLCRRTVSRTLVLLGVEPEIAADVELTVTEAASNVVRHAYQHPGHRYRVSVTFSLDRIQLRVEDEGRGVVREQVPEPNLEQWGGRGLWLMEQLAAFLTISQRSGGGCTLEATFALSQPLRFPPPLADAGRKGGAVAATHNRQPVNPMAAHPTGK